MRCEKGAVDVNLALTSVYIDQAEWRGIDIIAFPEASISGYSDRGKHPDAVISLDGPETAAAVKMTEGKNLTVLAGIMEENPAGLPYITHIVAREGWLAGVYRKIKIINEDIDWIAPGSEMPVFSHKDLVFGIAICSDISSEELYAEYARKGAQMVFELAAPGLYGEQATRNWKSGYEWWEGECLKYLTEYSRKYGIWIAVATQAGRTSDEDFPGGGYLFNPRGERVYATKDWNPCVVYLEIDFDTLEVTELT